MISIIFFKGKILLHKKITKKSDKLKYKEKHKQIQPNVCTQMETKLNVYKYYNTVYDEYIMGSPRFGMDIQTMEAERLIYG